MDAEMRMSRGIKQLVVDEVRRALEPDVSPALSCVVYTPSRLASALVTALTSRKKPSDLRWLEPSVGDGVFLRVLAKRGVRPTKITALDLDPTPSEADKLGQVLRPQEFLGWAATTRQRFDRIVGNPPYVSVRALPEQLREVAASTVAPDGTEAGLRSNLWYAFLCASMSLLKSGGALGFVLPAAWEYADYARPVRDGIAKHFRSVHVYRCSECLFDSVQEGSVVLVARGYRRGSSTLRRHAFAERGAFIRAVAVRRVPRVRTINGVAARAQPEHETVRLGDVASIRIGAVAGDADYFLLTEADRKAHGLPAAACRPIVSRAKHLLRPFITRADWVALRTAGHRVWLFLPPRRLLSNPKVNAYMKRKSSKGGCHRKRLKILARDTWYRTPLPGNCDGFLSGMSRFGPWVAFSRMRALAATNTLYVVTFRSTLRKSAKHAYALGLLTSAVRRQVDTLTRRYAGGLQKLEPGQIASLRVPVLTRTKGSTGEYRRAIAHLLAGELSKAMALADDWFKDSSDRATQGS